VQPTRQHSLVTLLVFTLSLLAHRLDADALDRLSLDRLAATHKRIIALRDMRRPVQLSTGYQDYRAILHAHSYLSHDSVGTIEEILAAAKATDVNIVMFTNHPATTYDYFEDGDRGVQDGVLLIPGAESGGMLIFPTRSTKGESTNPPQQFVNKMHASGGLTFVSHLEERLDWKLNDLTGNEIYNTHADFKGETRFQQLLRSPAGMLKLIVALQQYPQESFATIQDYPDNYMQAWDQWCQRTPHTGVAGNDSHHNQVYRGVVTKDRSVRIEDAFGEHIALLDPKKITILKPLIGNRKFGDELFKIDLDPYDRSFRHVSTHLLMHDLNREEVWSALRVGRAYVAFDWMADPTGFAFVVRSSMPKKDNASNTWTMGAQVLLDGPLHLQAEAPLAGQFKLLRNGKVIHATTDQRLEFTATEPGVYRIEVWLDFLGEPRPWIFSNPIYVR
jgi:hypothetical protein